MILFGGLNIIYMHMHTLTQMKTYPTLQKYVSYTEVISDTLKTAQTYMKARDVSAS